VKIVVQNPQNTSDTWSSGIHDYVVEFLVAFRPTIYLPSPRAIAKWFKWLRKKNLPPLGWKYAFSESGFRDHDVWLHFGGCPGIPREKLPKRFGGLKIFHTMDFSFWPEESAAAFAEARVDYLLGYSALDRWCDFYHKFFPRYSGRTIPWPYGFQKRFSSTRPFSERERKCSVMGAVNRVNSPDDLAESICAYREHYSDIVWAHPIRAALRDREEEFQDFLASYLARPPARVNLKYDSAAELNRHQLFVNDDTMMHYPPARTYEGTACGAVMLCSDHPCFADFGWKNGINCLTHRWADADDFARVAREALANQDELAALHARSLAHASRFSHRNVASALSDCLRLLLDGKTSEAIDFWR